MSHDKLMFSAPKSLNLRNRFRYFKEGDLTCTDEEKSLIASYALNMINAGFATRFAETVFKLSVSLIGKNAAYSLLKELYPDKIEYHHIADLGMWAMGTFQENEVAQIIQDVFAPWVAIMARRRIRKTYELFVRLNVVRETFKLSDSEMAILTFSYIMNAYGVVARRFEDDSLDLINYHTFKLYGDKVLGLDRRSFRSALSKSILFNADIISFDNGLSLDNRIGDYLIGIGDRELTNTYFDMNTQSHLTIQDFAVPPEELAVLEALCGSRNKSNILFYGSPGTGKTSLAKCLAAYLKMDIYNVKIDTEDNDDGFRLKAIYATLQAAQGKKTLIIVDEADEVLNTRQALGLPRSKSSPDKSWINNLLDTHDKKIIWITNERWSIEQSTMRRFDFSLELEQLSAKDRMNILSHELHKNNLPDFLTREEMKSLSNAYQVDASGIVHAVRLMAIKKRQKKASVIKMAESVLKNHEKALTGAAHVSRKKDFDTYTLRGLNTSHNLAEIVEIAIIFSRKPDDRSSRVLSLLLHGKPGTGKTEFVHYLGDQLGKSVVLKRASDIQDAYVGQTEKNIASAFRESMNDHSLLFFDEADSFLYPRRDAVRSWEKSFTNEILAQLDTYTGIVVFATNDVDGMDHAALRRFKFKIEFKPLTPQGIIDFYKTYLAPLVYGNGTLTDSDIDLLSSLHDLTAGDFAVVKDQFTFNRSGKRTHRTLIEALLNETRHKHAPKTIGY